MGNAVKWDPLAPVFARIQELGREGILREVSQDDSCDKDSLLHRKLRELINSDPKDRPCVLFALPATSATVPRTADVLVGFRVTLKPGSTLRGFDVEVGGRIRWSHAPVKSGELIYALGNETLLPLISLAFHEVRLLPHGDDGSRQALKSMLESIEFIYGFLHTEARRKLAQEEVTTPAAGGVWFSSGMCHHSNGLTTRIMLPSLK